MVNDFPKVGQVFDYYFLWHKESDSGEIYGRKPRNSCIAMVIKAENKKTVLFIVPITKQDFMDKVKIKIPQIEAKRAGLDTHIPLFVVVDEVNYEILEETFTLDSREVKGNFSERFMDQIIRAVQKQRKQSKLKFINRLK